MLCLAMNRNCYRGGQKMSGLMSQHVICIGCTGHSRLISELKRQAFYKINRGV